jgi:hypothetical protein
MSAPPNPLTACRTLRVPTVLLLVCACALPAGAQPNVGLRDQLVRDFRGLPLPDDMVPFGPWANAFLKSEPAGLRITLPRDRTGTEAVGLGMALTVGGDFEITTAFEILEADVPPLKKSSYGVGLLMSVNEKARIGRLVRAGNRQVVTWDRWVTANGEPKFLFDAIPCKGEAGRLRLSRTKNALHFLWSPELVGEQFEHFYECEFDAPEVTLLRLELNTDRGGDNAALDVRLLNLTIRSSTAPAEPVVAAADTPPARSNLWLFVTAVVVASFAAALVASLYLRLRRGRTAAARPAPPAPAKSADAFACPGCGKRLRTRAEVVGKKIKCPQCGQAVIAPGGPAT